ncbi:hypothetical protein LBMAG56_01050 [Verrucomicrobiota bacterium]|nr:hypothetical protein LBMAG56_01050 [Verrucomicrobiota bacterium]
MAGLLLPALAVIALALASAPAATEPTREQLEFFEKRIRPVLVNRCYECHSADAKKLKGGLALDTRDGLLAGGETGPAIVPGDPEKSRLIEAVRYQNRERQMPPKSALPADQIRDLEQWVKMGAPDPRHQPAAKIAKREIDLEAGRKFWAFQPIANPPVPTPKNLPASTPASAIRNPIDAFILAQLEPHGLALAAPADKRTLLRRATFDLTGLPPSPEDIAAFLADTAPDAFARVIDRLLNSPHYGERWGRHWLDVARYADSNGLDENVAFGNAWRYRDYVINAFNRDLPYDQFIREQIAGDLLPAATPAERHQHLTALGFLSIGPKLLAEPDKVKLLMDLIDEQIETLGRAFMGMTLGCARCHDHKFDPIPTADYYSLAAIFKSTHTMDDLKTIAKWHEPLVSSPADLAMQAAFDKKIAAQKQTLSNLVATANQTLLTEKKLTALPKSPETQYPTNTVAELKQLRAALAALEKEAPEMPSTMGVSDSTNIVQSLPIHIRGSHLNLGAPAARGVPQVMTIAATRPRFAEKQSGRLELANWLASPDHPLTARVMVNRIWRWHFGQGLVPSTDNFGALGDRPSHPELLDWIAHRFITDGWSLKSLHRLIMLSATYQQQSQGEGLKGSKVEGLKSLSVEADQVPRPFNPSTLQPFNPSNSALFPPFAGSETAQTKPTTSAHTASLSQRAGVRENGPASTATPQTTKSLPPSTLQPFNLSTQHPFSPFPIRRLEAEEIRDALLAVSGRLDPAMGGKTIPLKNREFVFNHTSKDATTYDSPRRALYLPIIRNHLYDLFEQFDYPDPAVPTGSRNATTVAPQALLMMNSDLVLQSATALATQLLTRSELTDPERLTLAYTKAYGRPPTPRELTRAQAFLTNFEKNAATRQPTPKAPRTEAWSALCQTILAANEFIYLN